MQEPMQIFWKLGSTRTNAKYLHVGIVGSKVGRVLDTRDE
jgi:hypothetical protein